MLLFLVLLFLKRLSVYPPRLRASVVIFWFLVVALLLCAEGLVLVLLFASAMACCLWPVACPLKFFLPQKLRHQFLYIAVLTIYRIIQPPHIFFTDLSIQSR